ncbi:MAG: hypothetical protein KA236_07780 [Verrucomicrobia bacterium]|nr:hypothetical protein [Verrucomicrobiota bacterium]
MKPRFFFAGLMACLVVAPASATNQVRTLNTPRTFPPVASLDEWQTRAREIREQILVSCGLWPMPEKTPLQARVFDRLEREGYTVEKVVFQSAPGFYVGGNLYRPRGRGSGPFPGILNPHGHWSRGRLADGPDGSVPARCISFARQGCVAFSYDMVGYQDTFFADDARTGKPETVFSRCHRRFATNAVYQLWHINLMGLQTWNSIRALDFLATLPDVEPTRLACTGASGGGTQTFMLGAVEDRLAAQAPVVMVSHSMQGGCLCENAPGLRIRFSNMEIAAAAAPRPQLLVAATGDWTRTTPTLEGPAIEAVYRLFDAAPQFRHVCYDFGHNYNQTSRETVAAWFARWLQAEPDAMTRPEKPYAVEPDAALQVFADGVLPPDAVTEAQLIAWFMAQRRAQLAALQPRRARDFGPFRDVMRPLWRHTLQLEETPPLLHFTFKPPRDGDGFTVVELEIRRDGETDPVIARHYVPARPHGRLRHSSPLIVLAHADGAASVVSPSEPPAGQARALLAQGWPVMLIARFTPSPAADPFANFYTTYNRTVLQHRVRDLATTVAAARLLPTTSPAHRRVVLCGEGRAGLWALLAAPLADAVVADCDQLDATDDPSLLAPDLFCPGLRALGGFETAGLLAAPRPLWLHNTGEIFATAALDEGYRALGASRKLRVAPLPLPAPALTRWLENL